MLRVMTITLAFLALTVSVFGDGWHIETVASSGNVGKYTSIELDGNDYPHISYQDDTNGDLEYTRWNGSSWVFSTIDTAGDTGWYTSIDLDSSDNPHIAYYAWGPYYDLKYTRLNGSSWATETVDSAGYVGEYPSLVLGSDDFPHISYHDGSAGDLNYAHKNGSTWTIQSPDTSGYVGEYTSICLSDAGDPRISYYDSTNGDLKVARWISSSWDIGSYDTGGDVGQWTSIVASGTYAFHISYFDYTNADLMRYEWGSAETVDSAGYVGTYTSIAKDDNDNLYISYYDNSDTDLKFAYYDGSSWDLQTIDSSGTVGEYTSIALDSGDQPHISYYRYTSGDLKYAWHNAAPGAFNLISPANGTIVDDTPTLDWSNSSDGGQHSITYDLWYSEDPTFSTYDEVTGLTQSTYTFSAGVLQEEHTYYWKVVASDGYEDTWCNQTDWSFTVNFAPSGFDLVSPTDGAIVIEPVTLDWEDSTKTKSNAGDKSSSGKDTKAITYDAWYSEETDFDPHTEINDLTDSTYTFGVGDLDDVTTYYWKVRAWDGYEETWSGSDDYWSFTLDNSTGVDGEGNLPKTFALHPAVPNPSDGSASIGFALPHTSNIELALYDIKGRKIATLATGSHQPGEYSADVSGLSSGIYIYELTANEFISSKKMVVR